MSGDPTEAVMDALIEHYPMFDINGHINGTVPGQGAWDCWCGRVNTVTREEVFEHAAQAIVGVLTANGWAPPSMVTQIQRLHYNDGEGWCREDGHSWPCHTARVVSLTQKEHPQ